MKVAFIYRFGFVVTLVSAMAVGGWFLYRMADASAGKTETGPYSKLYQDAMLEYDAGNYESSAVHYREMVARDPYDGIARMRLAMSIMNSMTASKRTPADPGGGPNSENGTPSALSENELLLEEAIQALTEAAEYRRRRDECNYQLARAYYLQNNTELAMEKLREISAADTRFNWHDKNEYFPGFIKDAEFNAIAEGPSGK